MSVRKPYLRCLFLLIYCVPHKKVFLHSFIYSFYILISVVWSKIGVCWKFLFMVRFIFFCEISLMRIHITHGCDMYEFFVRMRRLWIRLMFYSYSIFAQKLELPDHKISIVNKVNKNRRIRTKMYPYIYYNPNHNDQFEKGVCNTNIKSNDIQMLIILFFQSLISALISLRAERKEQCWQKI